MALEPLPGFQSLQTHHCVSGSMRHIYRFNGFDLSEEMLLGLGSGVGFIYWHMKGTAPLMGGRANVGRPSEEGLEKTAGRRTGVAVEWHITSSARRAERALLELLQAGQPVMILCDMGFLPYFDFGDVDYHFGWHSVVVCGHDAETGQVLLADRDGLHRVSLQDLARARGSTFKPFPPAHRWYTFDFSGRRPPASGEVWQAIADQVRGMLDPPISNLGVKGIRRAAQAALRWPRQMDEAELRLTLFNMFIFIDAEGGTGGGLFRYMFGRFLQEAAAITGEACLEESAAAFRRIGDRWQDLAAIFHRGWEAADPAALLPQTTEPLREIADLEEAAWGRLWELLRERGTAC